MKPLKQLKKTTTTTKTPARKPAIKAAAPASKTAVAETKLAKPARVAPTTIEAHVDVGFGNQLFVRGQGAGLSWERGVPLKNVGPQTWQWTAVATGKLTFKLLLNDAVWAQGADVTAAPGQKLEVTPNF